jgi:hypothetical protein
MLPSGAVEATTRRCERIGARPGTILSLPPASHFNSPRTASRDARRSQNSLPAPPLNAPGAGACVLVFSTNDRASFDAIPRWRAKVLDECGSNVSFALVQNKIDLAPQAAVTPAEVDALARKLGMRV